MCLENDIQVNTLTLKARIAKNTLNFLHFPSGVHLRSKPQASPAFPDFLNKKKKKRVCALVLKNSWSPFPNRQSYINGNLDFC